MSVCPCCGYCPHCGRGHYYYPYQQPYIWYGSPYTYATANAGSQTWPTATTTTVTTGLGGIGAQSGLGQAQSSGLAEYANGAPAIYQQYQQQASDECCAQSQ